MIKGKDILTFLSLKYEGNWDRIFDAIKRKEKVDEDELDEMLKKNKAHVLTCLDENYPKTLKHCYKPPFVLFYYGDISLLNDNEHNLTVIGSRKASSYGLRMTEEIVNNVTNVFTIVSGLADGIDTKAHEAAINSGGKTIAILGSGIDYCYPKKNLSLYQEIKKHHLLISEYPNETRPNDYQFPMRNRILAALSKAVLVCEAHKRSGSLITVGYALSNGKDIFCVPYESGKDSFCNRLIKDGAILCESAEDILFELGFEQESNNECKA